MLTFNHSGNIGDILYSLHFCKELSESLKIPNFNFHIQTNVKDVNASNQKHPFGDVRMTTSAAHFIKPLLQSQSYINNVSIDDQIPVTQNLINLDLFRQLKINFQSGDIRSWYYNLTDKHLPREFYNQIIFANKNNRCNNKIILLFTERYQNIFINYKVLEQFKDYLVFLGLEYEHKLFCSKYFNIEYIKTDSLKKVAEYMVGAKGVIGNQCGLFSLAECLKVPRILTTAEYFVYNNNIYPGPVNCHPSGGWNEVASTNEKLINSIKQLVIM